MEKQEILFFQDPKEDWLEYSTYLTRFDTKLLTPIKLDFIDQHVNKQNGVVCHVRSNNRKYIKDIDKDYFHVSIEDCPKIVHGEIGIYKNRPKELQKLFDWIKKNKEAIINHALQKTDTQGFFEEVRH